MIITDLDRGCVPGERLLQSSAPRRSHVSSPLSAEQGVFRGEAVWAGPGGWQGVFPPEASSLHLVTSPFLFFFWKDARGGGDAAFTGDDASGAHEVCLTAFSSFSFHRMKQKLPHLYGEEGGGKKKNCGTRPRKMAFNFYNVLLLISQEDV